MDSLDNEPKSVVEIEITAPSVANSEDEMEEFIPRGAIEGSNSNQNEIDNSSDSKKQNEALEKDYKTKNSEKDDELAKSLESDLALGDSEQQEGEEPKDENVEKTDENNTSTDEKPANLEMIGDRVLIERDGKFELVDVSEIKAEYFEMLGITAPEKQIDNHDKERETRIDNEESDKKTVIVSDEKPQRPKTSVNETRRKNTRNNASQRRTASANYSRSSRNDEYSHIKSMYGMSEEQLEIKRKREEAIAKRKKEEKERENEEMRRKREDAERAFQV